MARSFNGSTDKITVTTNAGISPTAKITLACWVYNVGFSGKINHLITKPAASTWTSPFADYALRVIGSGIGNAQHVSCWVTNASNELLSVTLVNTGLWYHLAFTYDGTTQILYINGSSDNTSSVSTAIGANGQDLHLGLAQTPDTNFLNGYLADVAIWNTNLSAGNITSLFNGVRPINVNSANLAAWWPLDGYASPETDLSGNSNSGTLTGTSQVLGPPALWRISG